MTQAQQQVQDRKLQQKRLKEITEQTELDARYFRSQFERKFYFLKLNEITPEFDALTAKLQAEQAAAQPEETVSQMHSQSEEALDSNPESFVTTFTDNANTEG